MLFSKTLTACAVAAATLLAPIAALADTHLASWNIRNLGWGDQKDYGALAEIGGAFDFIAVQEVMSIEGLNQLVAALEARTGRDWESLASDAVGRGSYKEFYAFVYAPDEVTWVDGAVVYTDSRDDFAREPFSARFRTSEGFEFVAGSVHLIYGDTVEGRQREAQALADYRDWLAGAFPKTPIMIFGDFNLAPDNEAWGPLAAAMRPLITSGATTLSSRDGKFANLYDNIWVPSETPLPFAEWGMLDFPGRLGVSHEVARDTISDHAPVWVTVDMTAAPVIFPPWRAGPIREQIRTPVAAATKGQDEASLPVRGNRNSQIYHLPHCPGYPKIAEHNRVHFVSEAEAGAAGYRIARNC